MIGLNHHLRTKFTIQLHISRKYSFKDKIQNGMLTYSYFHIFKKMNIFVDVFKVICFKEMVKDNLYNNFIKLNVNKEC